MRAVQNCTSGDTSEPKFGRSTTAKTFCVVTRAGAIKRARGLVSTKAVDGGCDERARSLYRTTFRKRSATIDSNVVSRKGPIATQPVIFDDQGDYSRSQNSLISPGGFGNGAAGSWR